MDPLDVLGIPPGSSVEDAKKRYRQLVQEYHPDHHPDDPAAPERFLEIQGAYEAIETNPSILDGQQPSTVSVLRINTQVSIEDFYLAKEIPIRISRQIFCGHCGGTGSETRETGLCTHCGGTGKITGNVLKLLNRDATCPICLGIGVPPQNLCVVCKGARYETDSSLRKIRLSLKDYHKKTIVLKNAGHQMSRNTFGNVFVKLQIKYDDRILIEDTYFRTGYKILPIQRIIGDDAEMTIFGRTIKFKIEKNATETTIEDKIAPGISNQVRIIFNEIPPVLTEDTIELYKKILPIEKQTSL